MKKNAIITIIYLIVYSFNPVVVYGQQKNCQKIKRYLLGKTHKLIERVEILESCALPAEGFRDKVFSNLKYRANRLKICIRMVQEQNMGFNCSREFKKTLKAQGGESCENEIKLVVKFFKPFESLYLEYLSCIEH